MQSLENQNVQPVTPDECAALLLDVVPLVMQRVRAEMRSRRAADLSVPQFRVLGFLNRAAGASLSDVAEFVGLSLPSMSKMMDGLVGRGLVVRQASPADRRCVTLTLTATGKATLEAARQGAQARLAELLGALSPADRATVVQALQTLRPVFSPVGETGPPTTH